MKIKTQQLAGAGLDYAVAKVMGYEDHLEPLAHWLDREGRPATDWAKGGPIIEKEHLTLKQTWDGGVARVKTFDAWKCQLDFKDGAMCFGTIFAYGHTPLEAAMRCYVLAKIGPEFEFPEAAKAANE